MFPILSLYAHNVYETSLRSLALPIVLVWIGTLVLWLVLRVLSRDGLRAALATSLFIALFFGFSQGLIVVGRVLEVVSQFWVGQGYRERPWLLLGILLCGLIPALNLIFRRLKNPAVWSSYLNRFALILVLLPTGTAALALMREPVKPITRAEGGISLHAPSQQPPDIYYIVLDAYARSDVLKELFDYDNTPFLDRLEQKGFYVARQSRSNYCQTALSLSSTLNLDVLDAMIDPTTHDLSALSTLICDNLVVKSLRPLGYQFVAYSTGYDFTECTQADRCLGPRHPADNFQMMLVQKTPLRYLPFEIESWNFYTSIRARIQFVLDDLPERSQERRPTFTFAHIVAPHHPFVFGENGEDVSPQARFGNTLGGSRLRSYATAASYREGYRRQAIYLTQQIEQTIDRILARSPEPPIIILQSDHGSGLRHHLNDLELTDLRERMSILNCYYFPDRNYEGLTQGISSVNTFRVVFNNIFGAKLPLLKNRNLFSTYDMPLEFVDVTDRLNSERDRGREYRSPDFFPGMVH